MATKRIGAIVLATDQGLGYLAKDFFDNGIFTEVFVKPHGSRENHYSWYPNRVESIDELLNRIDVLLMFETAFDWKVIPKARAKGIKTVLMPMYECTNNPLPYVPDLILNPSLLDQKYYPQGVFIPVPVPNHIKWKERRFAKTFVHNAGNGGLGGRNGTMELVKALGYIKKPIHLIIRSQVGLNIPHIKLPEGSRLVLATGRTLPKEKLWDEGDVFIFPEKFNGLSLPLQEAFASGMVVMAGDRFPMNTWLQTSPLIPVQYYKKERLAVEFDSAVYDPREIAKKIDQFNGKPIDALSEIGGIWGMKNSWKELGPQYLKLLCS